MPYRRAMLNLTEPYIGGRRDAPADLGGAGNPWSVRLQALLPTWLPPASRRWRISCDVAERLRTMSPRLRGRWIDTCGRSGASCGSGSMAARSQARCSSLRFR